MALPVFVDDFQVGHGCPAPRAPVDYILAAIDEPLSVQPHKDFEHGAAVSGVHGKAGARPIHGGAQTFHLVTDGVAVLLFPLPAALDEFLTPQLLPAALAFALPRAVRGGAGLELLQRLATQFP